MREKLTRATRYLARYFRVAQHHESSYYLRVPARRMLAELGSY